MPQTEETAIEIEDSVTESPPDTLPEKHGETVIRDSEESPKDVPNASVMNRIITLRLVDKLSIRQIAEEVNVSQATIGRILKGISVSLMPSQGENSQSTQSPGIPPPQQQQPPQQIFQAVPSQQFTAAPAPGIPADRLAYFLKKDQKGALIELLRENAMLHQQLSQGTGNPHPGSVSLSGRDRLRDAMADEIEYSRWERMTGKTKGNDGSVTWKDVLPYILEKQKSQNPGFNMMDFFKTLSALNTQNFEFANKQMAIVNSMRPQAMSDETRVKLFELEQNFEQRKMDSEREVQKWQAIQNTFMPFVPIAGQLLGQEVGKAVNPNSTNIECTSCGHVWHISTKVKGKIKCPECGSPVSPQFFGATAPTTFRCQGCHETMQISAKNIEEIIASGKSEIKAKCPKCGVITDLAVQTPEETLPPAQQAPPEEKPEDHRPKVHYT